MVSSSLYYIYMWTYIRNGHASQEDHLNSMATVPIITVEFQFLSLQSNELASGVECKDLYLEVFNQYKTEKASLEKKHLFIVK